MTATVKTEKLLMQKDGPIGWITFNQPEKRNAVSQEMWQAMPEYVADLAADDAIRVVILRGAGEQAFVAGADISQFKDRRRNAADEEEYRRISGAGSQSLAKLGKPLLAMIHGFCIGGGVSIAITCDMRIAADDARFGIPAARLGLGYHYHGMEKLMSLIGPAYTKELFFTARTDFSAPDALRMGLVNQVVPKADLERFTRDFGAGPFTVLDHIAFDEVTFEGAPAVYDHSSAFAAPVRASVATAATRSRGVSGLATCWSNPAASAVARSAGCPYAVTAIAGRSAWGSGSARTARMNP